MLRMCTAVGRAHRTPSPCRTRRASHRRYSLRYRFWKTGRMSRSTMLLRVAKGLGGGRSAFFALLLKRGRLALGEGPLCVDQLLAGQGKGDAGRPIADDGQRLTAPVETVIVAEGDGTGRRYRHVHPIAVGSLISLGLRLEISQRGIGKHRGFSSCS